MNDTETKLVRAQARIENLRACIASAAYRLDPLVTNGPLSSIMAALHQCLLDDDKAAEEANR